MKFRLSFFTSIIGAFCYIGMYFFTVFFLMSKINIGRWGIEEMWVLLGCFYIIIYAHFFLFWRGLNYLIHSIRNGQFDIYLLKPIDTQFLVASTGGSIQNLFAIIFGIGVLIFASFKFVSHLTVGKLLTVPLVISISVLDLFSFSLLLVTLNFKYGYLNEVLYFLGSFQDISRYPTDAFTKLPIYLLVFAIPFSALTTVPALIIIESRFPILPVLIFFTCSFAFILLSRTFFYKSIRHYTSGS